MKSTRFCPTPAAKVWHLEHLNNLSWKWKLSHLYSWRAVKECIWAGDRAQLSEFLPGIYKACIHMPYKPSVVRVCNLRTREVVVKGSKSPLTAQQDQSQSELYKTMPVKNGWHLGMLALRYWDRKTAVSSRLVWAIHKFSTNLDETLSLMNKY